MIPAAAPRLQPPILHQIHHAEIGHQLDVRVQNPPPDAPLVRSMSSFRQNENGSMADRQSPGVDQSRNAMSQAIP